MKAWVLHGVNDIRFQEVELGKADESEAIVKVKAVGICGSDVPRIYKTGAYSHPLIPGHEFAGEVVLVGDVGLEEWIGKRVGVFPLIPCRKCEPCRNKQFEMCRSYSYLGSRRDGGFAEYVAVPVENLIELPEEVSYEAAAMLEPMAVAVHAIRRTQLQPNDSVMVCGLGTIGLLMVMFLKEKGINNILVVGNKEYQKDKILSMGISADNYCDCRNENVHNWVMDRTNGFGVDIYFECVGKNDTISQAADCVKPAGNVVLVGNPASDMSIAKDVYWKILRNQLTIKGTWNSTFTKEIDDDWHYVLERLENQQVSPQKFISHRLSLDELSIGLDVMRDKKEDYVKIMVVNEE